MTVCYVFSLNSNGVIEVVNMVCRKEVAKNHEYIPKGNCLMWVYKWSSRHNFVPSCSKTQLIACIVVSNAPLESKRQQVAIRHEYIPSKGKRESVSTFLIWSCRHNSTSKPIYRNGSDALLERKWPQGMNTYQTKVKRKMLMLLWVHISFQFTEIVPMLPLKGTATKQTMKICIHALVYTCLIANEATMCLFKAPAGVVEPLALAPGWLPHSLTSFAALRVQVVLVPWHCYPQIGSFLTRTTTTTKQTQPSMYLFPWQLSTDKWVPVHPHTTTGRKDSGC